MIDRIIIAPDLPPQILWALAAAGIAIICLAILKGRMGGVMRAFAIVLLFILLLRPSLTSDTLQSLPNVVLVLKDTSTSATLAQREDAVNVASAELRGALEGLANIEIEDITVPGTQSTNLSESLATGLSGIARSQLAGIIALTDGQISDVENFQDTLPPDTPFHHFQIAHEDEIDRRISIIRAPRFGIINESAQIDFIIEDFGAERAAARNETSPIVTLYINGEEVAEQTVTVGQVFSITAPLTTPGSTFLELRTPGIQEELSTQNNAAIAEISVIQDRLRVLLISGEPHAGERVWRNLLKSDPAVDLIHFTILKPINKQAIASNEELSLIPFPENELFIEKLDQFDVLVFDRYTSRGVLMGIHFDSITQYIRSGGAVLISSGPEFISKGSLAQQIYLSDLLPVTPDETVLETPFRPMVNQIGHRHPITRDFEAADTWGRWMRLIGGVVRSGNILMTGPEERPLLIVDRIGEGRIAMLMSDHIWLWARGFEGGGPHRALLRRLVHWLMKEPDLEEEALRLSVSDRLPNGDYILTLTRQSLEDEITQAIVTYPDGTQEPASLSNETPGIWRGTLSVDKDGLYNATMKQEEGPPLRAAIYVGESASEELQHIIGTREHLADIIQKSGGGFFPIRRSRLNSDIDLPAIKYVNVRDRKARETSVNPWAGITDRKAAEKIERYSHPLLPAWVWFIVIITMTIGAWVIESQIQFRKILSQNSEKSLSRV